MRLAQPGVTLTLFQENRTEPLTSLMLTQCQIVTTEGIGWATADSHPPWQRRTEGGLAVVRRRAWCNRVKQFLCSFYFLFSSLRFISIG